MKQAVVSTTGEKTGGVELPDKIFGADWNPDLVHQALTVQQGNQRQVSAHAKDRSEVRGGGKKPWRQKGTGRARHGSTRSPLWAGGGVTHGPRTERNYKRKMNSKMKRKALLSALSEKTRQKQVLVVDSLASKEGKTKELVQMLKELPVEKKSTLLVLPTLKQNVIRAASNIPYVKTTQARELNLLDVMKAATIVFEKESIAIVEKAFAK